MTTPNDILVLCIAASMLWYLIAFRWRRLACEQLRFDLFVLRDRVFLATRRHDVPANHHSYRLMRRLLNSSIRHTEMFGLGAVVWARATSPVRSKAPEAAPLIRVDDLPEDVAVELEQILARYDVLMARHVLFGSPATLTVLLGLPVALFIAAWMNGGLESLGVTLLGFMTGGISVGMAVLFPKIKRSLARAAEFTALQLPNNGAVLHA